MVFTVLMAIWGLTSRSFRSPLKLVSLDNALPIGLAFGYAYAGSVAMLTVVLDDVKNVMMAGHVVVLLTFMWMQPTVLKGVFRTTHQASNIKAIVEKVVPVSDDESDAGESLPTEPTDAPGVEETSTSRRTPSAPMLNGVNQRCSPPKMLSGTTRSNCSIKQGGCPKAMLPLEWCPPSHRSPWHPKSLGRLHRVHW